MNDERRHFTHRRATIYCGRGHNKLWPCLLLLAICSSAFAQDLAITSAEYFWDFDPGVGLAIPIPLDSANTDSAFATFSTSADTLLPGLHNLYLRYQNSDGVWTPVSRRHIYIFQFQPWSSDYQEIRIAQAEYYFDDQPPVIVDMADGQAVSFGELVATAGLETGLHFLRVRFQDDRGVYTPLSSRYVNIFDQFSVPPPFVSNHLVGGEYWVNADPGIGNGIPFDSVADDGAWDEGEESTTFYLDGFPLGPTYFGVRFRDAFGAWSPALQDTVIAGPVLMVHRSGNNIVLDWIPGDSLAGRPFHIWRATQSDGPFAEVDTTSNLSWTDEGAVDSAATRRFYQIRQTVPAP